MLLDNSYNTLYRGYGCTLKFEVAVDVAAALVAVDVLLVPVLVPEAVLDVLEAEADTEA